MAADLEWLEWSTKDYIYYRRLISTEKALLFLETFA